MDTAPTPVIYPKNDGKKMSFERVCKDKVLYLRSRNDISYSKNLSRFIFFENPWDEVKNTFDFTPFACPEGIEKRSSDRVSFNKASSRIFDLSESLPYVSLHPSPSSSAISFTPDCAFAYPSPLSLCPSCPYALPQRGTTEGDRARVLSFAFPVTFGDGIGSTGTYGHKSMGVGDNVPLLPSKSKAKTAKEGVSMQRIPLSYLSYSVLSPMPFLPLPQRGTELRFPFTPSFTCTRTPEGG